MAVQSQSRIHSVLMLFLCLLLIGVFRIAETSHKTLSTTFNNLDDSIHFEVSWQGKLQTESNHLKTEDQTDKIKEALDGMEADLTTKLTEEETILLSTRDNEAYRCLLPEPHHDVKENIGDSEIVNPKHLLQPILEMDSCSILVDTYWSYELCHGRHLRQFHEVRNKDGHVAQLTEYYLGYFDKEDIPTVSDSFPKWKFNDIEYPYYSMKYQEGTPCDLRENVARSAKVLYICDEKSGKNPTFFQLIEVSTCTYQALVSVSQLCQDTRFRVETKPVHLIKCFSENDSPRQPRAYTEHYHSMELNKIEIISDTLEERRSIYQKSPREPTIPLDNQFVKNFLSGASCLKGKSAGWWQNEFCFGEHVKQVHMEGKQVKQEIVLGYWDESKHREWFQTHGTKKHSKTHVTHWYSNGNVCESTGLSRNCQVRFKCIQNDKPNLVSISLQEPTECSYIMIIEAGFICRLLDNVDQYGIFRLPSSD